MLTRNRREHTISASIIAIRTMTDRGESVGVLFDPTPFTLQEEEVPREGVRVRRVPSLARTRDGR